MFVPMLPQYYCDKYSGLISSLDALSDKDLLDRIEDAEKREPYHKRRRLVGLVSMGLGAVSTIGLLLASDMSDSFDYTGFIIGGGLYTMCSSLYLSYHDVRAKSCRAVQYIGNKILKDREMYDFPFIEEDSEF